MGMNFVAGRVSRNLWRLALWVYGCQVLTGILAGQCSTPTVLPDATILSGTVTKNDYNALKAFNVTIGGSAIVKYAAPWCVDLWPNFHATAGTASTTFHGWIDTPPYNITVLPGIGAGTSGSFTWTAKSYKGYTHVQDVFMLYSLTGAATSACYLDYNQPSNKLYLADNSGTNWGTGLTPGGSGTLSNNQCRIAMNSVSIAPNSTDLMILLTVTFLPSFSGTLQVMESITDTEGLYSPPNQVVGQWTTTGSSTPSITSLSPTSGAVGATVVINGNNFGATQGSSTAQFASGAGGVSATVSSWTNAAISAVVPTSATTGNVTVTVGGNPSNGVPFTVVLTPAISSLSPSSGPQGGRITITGTNFGASQGTSTVKFNGTAATASAWSTTSIQAVVPSGATSGNVTVTVAGMVSNGVAFTVTPAPSITGLTPVSAPVGGTITISGANFGGTQGTSAVKLNGTVWSVSSWSNTSVNAVVPAGATSGSVTITVAAVASNGSAFTVDPAPAISSIAPATGQAGTPVTITGTGFGAQRPTSTVSFSGVAANVSNWTTSTIAATAPTGISSGNVVVTVAGVASNGLLFTIQNGPTISSISPSSGYAGDSITIAGTNFGGSQGSSIIKFNNTVATVVPTWTSTSIVAQVPAGATSGQIAVTVGGLTATSTQSFTVNTIVTREYIRLGPRVIAIETTQQ